MSRPRASHGSGPAELEQIIGQAVQFLAFRLQDTDLTARFEPGRARLSPAVRRFGAAAVELHRRLERDATEAPSRAAALAARGRLARQLADMTSGVERAPAYARRWAYLDALAAVLLDKARRDGPASLEGWTA